MNKSGEVVETTKFHPGQSYTRETEILGLELGHERSTSLGHNIYAGRSSGSTFNNAINNSLKFSLENNPELNQTKSLNVSGQIKTKPHQTHFPADANQELAKEELNLLAKLIGTKTELSKKDVFRLNMFDLDTEEEPLMAAEKHSSDADADNTLNISLNSSQTRHDLEKIISEMTVTEDNDEDDDLLALMDQAT